MKELVKPEENEDEKIVAKRNCLNFVGHSRAAPAEHIPPTASECVAEFPRKETHVSRMSTLQMAYLPTKPMDDPALMSWQSMPKH